MDELTRIEVDFMEDPGSLKIFHGIMRQSQGLDKDWTFNGDIWLGDRGELWSISKISGLAFWRAGRWNGPCHYDQVMGIEAVLLQRQGEIYLRKMRDGCPDIIEGRKLEHEVTLSHEVDLEELLIMDWLMSSIAPGWWRSSID